MARTVTDAKLESKSARQRLVIRKKPYFRSIDPGRHLGYYKGSKGGMWLARINDNGIYREQKIGAADDIRDANNLDVLSFAQAQFAARNWFAQYALNKSRVAADPVISVRVAVQEYIAFRNLREAARQGRPDCTSSAAHKLNLHVLDNPEIADLKLEDLKIEVLKKWRAQLPGTGATRQRVTNDFKAALNSATRAAEVKLVIKDGLAATVVDISGAAEGADSAVQSKILTDDEVRTLLKAIAERGDDDIYRMCLLLAATGTRFAQARRLRVRDVQLARQRIMIPASYKGRSSGQPRSAVPVPIGKEVVDAMVPIISGRDPSEILLQRWRHVQIGAAQWERDRRAPWQTPSELARPIRAAARAASLPSATSSYSFRHSSIVRGLRDGLPVRLVAQLHDTSIQMIERNYTRFLADALEDLARNAIVSLTA
jgi:integrase